MADEGLYSLAPGVTPQALAARRRMAEALLAEGTSTKPIQHWTQGAANVVKALMGGYEIGKTDREEANYRADANRQFQEGLASMQGQGPVPSAVQPQLTGGVPGRSAGMIPGYNGEPPRPKVASSGSVMGDDEAIKAGLYDAPPGGGSPSPGVPMPQPNPMRSPVATALAGGQQPQGRLPISPAMMAAIGNPYLAPGHAAVASHLVNNALNPEKQQFQTLPNGDILALDPTGRLPPRVVFNAPKNPTMVGLEEDKEYFNRDINGNLTPIQRPAASRPAGAPGDVVIPPPPAGADSKEWRKKYTAAAVPALSKLPGSEEGAMRLRKEISDLPSYKNYAQSAPVIRSMSEAAARDNRAADVNLIYGLGKIMDPGSVVRESEMTMAQAIATLPQRLQATVTSQLNSTGRLSPDVRRGIMEEAHSRVNAYKSVFDLDAQRYHGIATRNRFDPQDVIPTFPDLPAANDGWIDQGGGVRVRRKPGG